VGTKLNAADDGCRFEIQSAIFPDRLVRLPSLFSRSRSDALDSVNSGGDGAVGDGEGPVDRLPAERNLAPREGNW
jgi:hypothetical protein